MLFRVWCKDKNEWEKDQVRIDSCGNQYHRKTVLHDWMYVRPDNHIVEFNTGIALADGTELFFRDIVRWKDREITPFGYGSNYRYIYAVITEEYIRENMIRFVEYQKEKKSEKPIFTITFDDDRDGLELVGNIHETELTDAMKIWIKE